MNSSLPLAVPGTTGRTPAERFRRQGRSRLLRGDLLTVAAWASVSLAVTPWLADDGAVGHDRALKFHRLSKPSLYLLLAHGILIAIGYGLAEGLDPVSELVVETRFGTVQVQTISGATVTSAAYLSSLQGALDATNL